MSRIISASRRTDLIAHFPVYLSEALKKRKAVVIGTFKGKYEVDLSPDNVHTIVLWSKDFSNIVSNKYDLKEILSEYSQLYFLFTITGLGGTFLEPLVPKPEIAISQIDDLVKIAGNPERVAIRFDPIIYWKKDGNLESNLYYFNEVVKATEKSGVKRIIFSFMSIYPKCVRRAEKAGIEWIDLEIGKKREIVQRLYERVEKFGLELLNCCNPETLEFGAKKASCIDGELLNRIHPKGWKVEIKKDPGQRKDCGCNYSVEIGSYVQSCPHACLYCYANPKV